MPENPVPVNPFTIPPPEGASSPSVENTQPMDTTAPVAASEPNVSPVLEGNEDEKKECLTKIGEILKKYQNLESNIPPNHEYWGLLGKYRAL